MQPKLRFGTKTAGVLEVSQVSGDDLAEQDSSIVCVEMDFPSTPVQSVEVCACAQLCLSKDGLISPPHTCRVLR